MPWLVVSGGLLHWVSNPRRLNYVDVQQLFDELMPAGDFRCYWKARYLSELPDEMIDRAMADAAAAPSANSLSSLWNFGGAVSQMPADETAFGDRSMGWMYSLDAVWSDSKEDAANIAWSRAGWEESAKWDHEGRIYLNFPGHGEDNLELTKQAFGPNYARLAEIKAQYDPNNVFRFNQNISPAA